MSRASEQIKEFHDKFGLPNRAEPNWPPKKERKFRKRLIEEESAEAFEAMKEEKSIQHVAKELADILYVVYGAACHYGIDLDATFDAVHASNMTKLWACKRCGGSGYAWDGQSAGDICAECDGDGKVVRYRDDGKVLKPDTYTPADLSFIEEPQDD